MCVRAPITTGEGMNREDIIRMAEECGIPEFENNESQAENIMRFAALVASVEREACAKLADEWAVGWPHPSKVIALDIRARGQA